MSDPSSLTDSLRAAVLAVEAAEVPDDLREIAFSRALDATLGHIPTTPPDATVATHATPLRDADPSISSDSPLRLIAKKMGISATVAETLYYVEEGKLTLVLAPSKFQQSLSHATVEIGRLVIAGRQAAGFEDWTPVSAVREACQDRGKFNRSNFAAYLGKLDGSGFIVRGSGQGRMFKANAAGFEQAGELATQLTAQE